MNSAIAKEVPTSEPVRGAAGEAAATGQAGDSAAVAPLLESLRAYTDLAKAVGDDPALGKSLALQAMPLAMRLYVAGRRECIDAVRLGLKFSQSPVLGHIDLHTYLWRFRERAQLDDFTRELTPEQIGKKLLIACFPKSGSTLLKRLLCLATGFGEAQLVSSFLQNEQEIYLPALLAAARTDCVIQQHCRATGPNLHMLQAFGIRPVVLVRNIFDVLLSWKEFLDAGASVNTFFPNYQKLSDEERLALVIDDRAPWYLSFFAGWQHAISTGYIDGFWMTFGEITAEPQKALASILKFYRINAQPERIEAAAQSMTQDRDSTRFNKGIVGRGRGAFTEAQMAQVRRLASYYSGTDFSLIGL